jgi:broad specificity phosphatase PhoE
MAAEAAMELLLIRHGEAQMPSPENYSAEKDRPDPELTERGLMQAERLGKRLAGSGLRAVYASDLVRARQTAEAVGRHAGLPIILRDGLREIHMGRLQHCSWERYREIDPAYCDAWHRHESDLPYPGGETGAQAAERAMRIVGEIIGMGLDKVAVVAHGGTIRVFLCAALGIAQEKRFLFAPPENTSVTRVEYKTAEKRFFLAAYNDYSHLASEHRGSAT